MQPTFRALLGATALTAVAAAAQAQTVTIATVNNGDMIRMQGLTQDFTEQHPDIDLEWVTLEENVLRQRVTQDIATGGGQFDVMTIGNYEVPIWANQGWLTPLEDMPEGYDADDILPAIAGGLSVDGTLYAAPFYGEFNGDKRRRREEQISPTDSLNPQSIAASESCKRNPKSIAASAITIYKGNEFNHWNGSALITSLKDKSLRKLDFSDKKNVKEEIIFKNKIGRIRDIQINPSTGKIYLLSHDALWLMEKN